MISPELAAEMRGQNLVPYRTLSMGKLTYTSGDDSARVKIPVNDGDLTRGYILAIKAQKTQDSATAAVAFYAVNSGRGAKATKAELANLNGLYLTNGAAAEIAAPAWIEEVTLDVCGVEEADFSADSDVTVHWALFELVPATLPKGQRP